MNTDKLERAKCLIGQIETLNSELHSLFGNSDPAPITATAPIVAAPHAAAPSPSKKRNMTPKGRAAISAAAKKRWAAFHKAKPVHPVGEQKA